MKINFNLFKNRKDRIRNIENEPSAPAAYK